MKIIFCLNHFLPDQVAGTEIYTLELARELKSRGHQVLVVVPNFGKSVNHEYEIDGIDVVCYAEPQVVDRAFMQGRKAPAGLVFFVRVLESFDPAIVHFQEITASGGMSLFHIKAAKEKGYKTVMTFHLAGHTCHTGSLMYEKKRLCEGVIDVSKCARCSYSNKRLTTGARLLLFGTASLLYRFGYDTRKWQSKTGTALAFPFLIKDLERSFFELLNACDHVVSITNWYKRILLENGADPSKLSYIPQGFRRQSLIGRPSENDGIIKLVFVGRITWIKGLHLLIEAMKNLPQDKISLTIFGKYADEEYYRSCLKKAQEAGNIFWKGNIPPDEVSAAISKFDVLCLPSGFSEMSPLVIQEAFAAGVPVLASNVYGNAEQITHNQNGWLFQFESVKSLRQRLKELIFDRERIERAKNSLPGVRSFESIAGEYENLYRQILVAQ